MSRRVAVAALVACIVLAGCGGPLTDTDTTTESDDDGERLVNADPGDETTAEGTTNETTISEAYSEPIGWTAATDS